MQGSTDPSQNDLSVCAYCFCIAIFDQGKLRPLTRSDIEKMSPKEAFQLGKNVGHLFKRIAEARKALAECDGV
jgi:hypothetical protein